MTEFFVPHTEVPWIAIVEGYDYVLIVREQLFAYSVPSQLVPIFIAEDFRLYRVPARH